MIPTKPPIATDMLVQQLLPEVTKGRADWREYRPLRLANGVTCMLVHDKESKTTAMAACVRAGAAADPRHLPGLAHFTEHMCFLGSDKYPGENEYKRYLASHGGRSNASTSLHLTTYKFDILADHADKAVDMFAHFFTSPLFTQSGTSREIQAVDSENSKNLTDDSRRRLQILKALADPTHYYSKFTTGNTQTLLLSTAAGNDNKNNDDDDHHVNELREALLAFHRYHYRPDNLTVVIVGPQSLDTLQEWVVPRFSPMVQRRSSTDATKQIDAAIAQAAVDMPPFGHDQPVPPYKPAFSPNLLKNGGTSPSWPVLLTVLPLKSMRQLSLNFPMPPHLHLDPSPVNILSHLLGHEGPGSAFAVLQSHGLLTSLSAGSRIAGPDQTLFQLSAALTEQGEAQWHTVVDILLAHCRLMRETCSKAQQGDVDALQTLRNLWGEVATLQVMKFDQTSPGAAYDFAPGLAQNMVLHGTAKCLSAGNMLDETPDTFPLDQVVASASRLEPTNCVMERCSPTAWKEMEKQPQSSFPLGFGKLTEKWYGIDYYLSPIDSKIVREWEGMVEHPNHGIDHEALHLPKPNRYIPRTLELCADLPEEAKLGPRIDKDIDPPNLLVNEEGIGRLWHRLDDRYALPKSCLSLLLRNAAVDKKFQDGTWTYDVHSSVQSSILSGLFAQALAQETYDAEVAGLHWSLSTSSAGIQLAVAGYSDRLPEFALKVLRDFLLLNEDTFFQESYFDSTKDKLVRNLRTYFESRRADAHAMYYRDLLMASRNTGIESSLLAAEATSIDSLKQHHKRLLQNPAMEMECLFSGNVAESEAKDFFERASGLVQEAARKTQSEGNGLDIAASDSAIKWVPGPSERRLEPGQEIELHFASKNAEEENGAVLVTYQSQIPGFKGDTISLPASLKSSACIRLLCHILREPLFNDLRTKQQLGYVVSSYYNLGFSCCPPEEVASGPWTTPIDYIDIIVLSRKASPPEVTQRIDEFLKSFRETLMTMPESEINHHADALGKKLLKPVQKLGTEATGQYGKSPDTVQKFSVVAVEMRTFRGTVSSPWRALFNHSIAKIWWMHGIAWWRGRDVPGSFPASTVKRFRYPQAIYSMTSLFAPK